MPPMSKNHLVFTAVILSLTTGQHAYCKHDYKIAQKKLKNVNDDFEDLKKCPLAFKTDKSIASDMASKDDEFTIELAQLEVLFEAAIKNSPDINFVLAKLAPNADLSETATKLMKQASIGPMALTVPNLEPGYPQITNANKIPSYQLPTSKNKVGFVIKGDGTMTDQSYTQNPSFNAFSQILGTAENNRKKKANLSQAEQIMLYNMLRTTRDKVLGHYRDYKISRKKLFKAKIDSAPQNEIEQQEKQLVIYRQHLIDLAGQEAVDNLDQKLDAEFKGSAQH